MADLPLRSSSRDRRTTKRRLTARRGTAARVTPKRYPRASPPTLDSHERPPGSETARLRHKRFSRDPRYAARTPPTPRTEPHHASCEGCWTLARTDVVPATRQSCDPPAPPDTRASPYWALGVVLSALKRSAAEPRRQLPSERKRVLELAAPARRLEQRPARRWRRGPAGLRRPVGVRPLHGGA